MCMRQGDAALLHQVQETVQSCREGLRVLLPGTGSLPDRCAQGELSVNAAVAGSLNCCNLGLFAGSVFVLIV